jgi:hypothetical protein
MREQGKAVSRPVTHAGGFAVCLLARIMLIRDAGYRMRLPFQHRLRRTRPRRLISAFWWGFL